MKKDSWIVTDYAVRPAGKPGECFYCNEPLGVEHKPECVIRRRTVVVQVTTEYVVDVGESWTEDNIEFHRNESTWCASNGMDEIVRMLATRNDLCCCGYTSYKYLREATAEDEERDGIYIESLPDR